MHICRRNGCHTEASQVLLHGQEEILDRLEEVLSKQDDINNAVQVVAGFLTDVSAQVTRIQTLLDNGVPTEDIDTSQLNALVEGIPLAQAALDAVGVTASTGSGTASAG